jgi:exo-beta-1,3-glucanase (GH17 family)
VDSIGAATTPSRSTSKSSSSSSSSSTASPTPYNIYPKPDSTLPQQSAFAQDLERIAQPGSVTRITGGRDQLLLWVASLTPAQASVISRNPVVSPHLVYFTAVVISRYTD